MWPFKRGKPTDVEPEIAKHGPDPKNNFLVKLSEREDLNARQFSAASDARKCFIAVFSLERDVNGNGFESVFSHWDTAMIRYCPNALRQIGPDRCAAIVDEAIAFVEPHVVDDDWESAIDELYGEEFECAEIEELDQKFYAYPDDLTGLLFRFVMQHPEAFGPVPAGLA